MNKELKPTKDFPFTYDEYRRVQIAHKKGEASLDDIAGMAFYMVDTPDEYINELLNDPVYKQLEDTA